MKFIDKYIIAGRRSSLWSYVSGICFGMIPSSWLIRHRSHILKDWESRPDAEYIRWRRDFYCPDNASALCPEFGSGAMSYRKAAGETCKTFEGTVCLRDIRLGKVKSRYALDAASVFRYFPGDLKINFLAGDCLVNPELPTVIKARRIDEGRENVMILKMDTVFLYMRPKDRIAVDDKKPQLLFRGQIHGKPRRQEFFRKWAGHPLFDLGDTDKITDGDHANPWKAATMTVPEQFHYRFILTLEGNDLSSSLQWVMASNCVPVMPRPSVESWMMESEMTPGVHYIEIASDFSDAAEKIQYYIDHPEETRRISEESRKWAEQFYDKKREKIIALLAAEKYFRITGQLPSE